MGKNPSVGSISVNDLNTQGKCFNVTVVSAKCTSEHVLTLFGEVKKIAVDACYFRISNIKNVMLSVLG